MKAGWYQGIQTGNIDDQDTPDKESLRQPKKASTTLPLSVTSWWRVMYLVLGLPRIIFFSLPSSTSSFSCLMF